MCVIGEEIVYFGNAASKNCSLLTVGCKQEELVRFHEDTGH